jgi:hypothetical protein
VLGRAGDTGDVSLTSPGWPCCSAHSSGWPAAACSAVVEALVCTVCRNCIAWAWHGCRSRLELRAEMLRRTLPPVHRAPGSGLNGCDGQAAGSRRISTAAVPHRAAADPPYRCEHRWAQVLGAAVMRRGVEEEGTVDEMLGYWCIRAAG